MDLVITISGLHGTGKTTYAKTLAKNLSLRHVSAGMLFRRLAAEKGVSISDLTTVAEKNKDIDCIVDKITRKEAESGSVIIDGLLAGWIAQELANIKVYLMTPNDVRFSRIAKRDDVSTSVAKEITLFRERVERKRFKKYYNFDLDDMKIYDLILNTELLPIESNVEIINKLIQEYIKSYGGK